MNFGANAKGAAYTAVTLLIWSFFAVFSRMLQSQQLNSWDLTFIRFAAAFGLLALYMLFSGSVLRFRIGPALLLSIFGGAGYCAVVYLGFLYAPVAHAAIWLNACIPVSTFALAWLLQRSQLKRNDYVSAALIVCAVCAMLLYGWLTQQYQFSAGDLCFFAGSVFWASYTLLLKHFKVSIKEALIGVTALSFVLYTPVYLLWLPKNLLQEELSVIALQGFFHGGLMMIAASITYIKSIEYLGAVKAGSMLALAPFLAVLLAIPLLGEWPDTSVWIGLAGLLLAIVKPWQLRRRAVNS